MPHHTNDNENNTEEIEEGSRSILLSIASQLTKGTDLVFITIWFNNILIKPFPL